MSVDLIEATLLIRDPNARLAFAECDRRRNAATAKVNAKLEEQFGPANRPDDKWPGGINLWREHRINAVALEYAVVLLKIKDATDETVLSREDQNSIIACICHVRGAFYSTSTNREIVDDLISRALKITDDAHRKVAIRMRSQPKWWWM